MVDPIALLTLCPNSSAQRGVFKQESLQIAFCRPFQKVLYSLNKVWPHFTHVLSKIAALLWKEWSSVLLKTSSIPVQFSFEKRWPFQCKMMAPNGSLSESCISLKGMQRAQLLLNWKNGLSIARLQHHFKFNFLCLQDLFQNGLIFPDPFWSNETLSWMTYD